MTDGILEGRSEVEMGPEAVSVVDAWSGSVMATVVVVASVVISSEVWVRMKEKFELTEICAALVVVVLILVIVAEVVVTFPLGNVIAVELLVAVELLEVVVVVVF